jgi:GR25 family glycosyltransferase involved in LPS biosynthesis
MKIDVILIIILILLLIYYRILLNNNIDKFENLGINNVDVVYFINLDHRIDRLYEFLSEMKKINFPFNKIIRIPAIHKPKTGQGHWGCSLSHIKTLEHFISSEFNNCIVFEDDFEFTKSPDEINDAFNNLFQNNIDYDVCMLSSYTIEQDNSNYPFLKKINHAATTSGYLLSKKFANTLLHNYKEGVKLLERMYNGEIPDNGYCLDQYWQSLQANNKWYVFEPKLGKQRSSYSDIMSGYIEMPV